MNPNPLYDKPGYCALCHNQIADQDTCDRDNYPRQGLLRGQKFWVLRPDFELATFELNDGSLMRVALCTKCKATMTADQVDDVMESVRMGWKYELETCMKLNEAERSEHVEKHKKLEIAGRQDDVRWDYKVVEAARTAKKVKNGNDK